MRMSAIQDRQSPNVDDLGIERLFGEDAGRYYIFGEGGRAPSIEHSSRYKASKEARRLARKHPGTRFHLLKLKETVVFHQDILLEDRVRITDRDSIYYADCGRILSIDPNGLYAVRFLSSDPDETKIGAFNRDQFKLAPLAERGIEKGTRVMVRDYPFTRREYLTGTIEEVDSDNQVFFARLDRITAGSSVMVPFHQFEPIKASAFGIGDWVTINSTHYRHANQKGYVTRTDEATVFVRFMFGEPVRFHPYSLTVTNDRPALSEGQPVRICDPGGLYDDRVGIVDEVADDHRYVRFSNEERGLSFSSAFLRPAAHEDLV